MATDSYLVNGAKLKCICGSETGELKVENKNVCLMKVPIATEDDCVAVENIPSFGICKHTGEPCVHNILGKWLLPHDKTEINGALAITTDSGLVCGNGGLIVSESSGQETIIKLLKEMFQIFKDLFGFGCSPFSSDPVNLCTGNYVLQVSDLVIKGAYPLHFTRTYNSLSDETGVCGLGWSHNCSVYLEEKKDTALLHLGEGGQVRTFVKSKGDYQTDEMVNESFKKTFEGYEYQDTAKRTYKFSKNGCCTEIRTAGGHMTTFEYIEGLLSKVWNPSGCLMFQYDDETRLSEVSDHTGRSVNLVYQDQYLKKVSNLLGGFKEYVYDEYGRLSVEITPQGIKKIRNYFDEYGRTIKQEFADGGVMLYEYDDDAAKVTMTLQNGNKIKFYRDQWQRDRRITSSSGQIEKQYNDRHQLEVITDRNGNKTIYRHDDLGNICCVVDAAGYETYFIYDQRNNPILVQHPDGSETKTRYNLQNKVIMNTDQLGRSYEYEYHKNGMVETIIHPDGSMMNIEFDSRSNVVAVTNPFGSTISYRYDHLNRLVAAVDGNGNTTKFEYNDNNDVIKMINAAGDIREYCYDENGRITEIIAEDGLSSAWEYNDTGHPVKKTDRQGRETLLEYDLMWNVCQEKIANGGVVNYSYNRDNLLEKVVSPEGGETYYQYDANGNCIKKIMPDGGVFTFCYDSLNRLIQTRYPNGSSCRAEYNHAGKMIRFIDVSDREFRMEYDAAGQRVKDIMPNRTAKYYEYNEMGLITQITEPQNRITKFTYLPGGRLSRVAYPDGSSIEYCYDRNANVIWKRDQRGYQIDFEYDPMNRLLVMRSNRGESKRFTYDAMGNVLSMTNSKGIKTTYQYTGSGKLQAVIDPFGTKTLYEYDAMDQLVAARQVADFDAEMDEAALLKRQNERMLTSYCRNLDGDIISEQYADGAKICYQKDYLGRPITKTNEEGADTHYAYDQMGNLKKVLYPDGRKTEMRYNALGQLIELKDWLGTTQISRNTNGQPESIIDYQGNVMQYEWNQLGKRSKTIYPDGKQISYEYHDVTGKLSRICWDENWIDYEYNEAGHLYRKLFSNGAATTYGYQPDGQLNFFLHAADREMLKYRYEYDVEGFPIRITEETENGTDVYRYQYDKLGRLVEVFKGLPSIRRYKYDVFGNRILKKEGNNETRYQYNERNQLIFEESNDDCLHYDYDLRGNIQAVYANELLQERHIYNAENRLERIQKDDQEFFYQYDGFGHRVMKQTRSVRHDLGHLSPSLQGEREEIRFMVDYTRTDHNLIHETGENEERHYIWEPNSHKVAAMLSGDDSFYFESDHLGSPVRVTNQRAVSVAKYSYDDFGSRKSSLKNQMKQAIGFTGYYEEEQIGLYQTEMRCYNPGVGIFYSRDCIKGNTIEPATLHPYQFCWNNPIMYLDLDGAYPGAYTQEEGDEAHLFLQQYFTWYYSASPSITTYTEFEIPNASINPLYDDGRADFVLISEGIAELTDLKPDSERHLSDIGYINDRVQLDKYITEFTNYTKIPAVPGYTFNPNGLRIKSVINPDYYIVYQTYYSRTFNYPTTGGHSFKGSFEGFIYWGYEEIKDDQDEDKRLWVWVRKNNGKNGEYENHRTSIFSYPQNIKDEDIAAIKTGGGLALLWLLVKLGVGGATGQFWVVACP